MRGKNQSIHEYMAEQTGLAETYAEDGAFFSAARVLRELAKEVDRHAQEVLIPDRFHPDPRLQRPFLPEDEADLSG